MSKKNKQAVENLKKSLKSQDIQKIKNQIRTGFISQNDLFQQTQSISNSRSSCFPKRSKALYKQINIHKQRQGLEQLTKHQKMKIDEILQKQQINQSFDYLFNQFNSNSLEYITSCVESKINQYSKIMFSYMFDPTSINQIVLTLLDWNLVISSWYWTKWTQNYKYLSILNSIIGNIFWKMYMYYMNKELQLYQMFIVGSLKNNSCQLKKFNSLSTILKKLQVFDIKMESFLSKEYLGKDLSLQYEKKFEQQLIQYLLQKQQTYQCIYLKYEAFKETTFCNEIQQIQNILNIQYSNYHQILYNDNMEIIIQKFLLKLTQKIEGQQIVLESQIQRQCKILKIVTQYITTRMIIIDQDQRQECFQQNDYKERQTQLLLAYLYDRLARLVAIQSQLDYYNSLIKELIISSKRIYQFDAKDSYLSEIKKILNLLIHLIQKNEAKTWYKKNFDKFIQLHNNLIEMILNLQTTFLNDYESQNVNLNEQTMIQYFYYFEGLLYCFLLKKQQKQLLNMVNKTEIQKLEYNLLQLLDVNLRQKKLNLIKESCDLSLFLKLKQYYQKQFQIISFNKNKNIFIESQTSNQIIVEYFFEVVYKYFQNEETKKMANPQIQI